MRLICLFVLLLSLCFQFMPVAAVDWREDAVHYATGGEAQALIREYTEQRLTARPGFVAADVSFARTIFDMGHRYMVDGSANTISGHPGHSFCYETSESAWVGSWIRVSNDIMRSTAAAMRFYENVQLNQILQAGVRSNDTPRPRLCLTYFIAAVIASQLMLTSTRPPLIVDLQQCMHRRQGDRPRDDFNPALGNLDVGPFLDMIYLIIRKILRKYKYVFLDGMSVLQNFIDYVATKPRGRYIIAKLSDDEIESIDAIFDRIRLRTMRKALVKVLLVKDLQTGRFIFIVAVVQMASHIGSGNRVNRDEGNSPIPLLDRSIALFLSQASGRSTLFGQSPFYDRSTLRQMLETDSAQSFLPMIRRLIPQEVGIYTVNQAAGHAGIRAAVTNRQTAMIARLGREVTLAEAHIDLSQAGTQAAVTNRQTLMIARLGRPVTGEEAHSSLGHDGIQVAVTNCQTLMIARDGREVTREEALTDLTSTADNRSVALAGLPSVRRGGRLTMPMDERRALASLARTIVDRGFCETPGCRSRQATANIRLCKDCITEKNKHKREEDKELGARICAECGDEVASDRKMSKGCCQICYQRQYRKTGRVIDPEKKLCTHVSVCSNMRHMGGLCQRHHRNRHLEASADSECAAAASAATVPKKKRTMKTRNGKKKMKMKKPVVINKTGKTVGETSVHYEDEEVEVEVDSDYDDEDEWAEGH